LIDKDAVLIRDYINELRSAKNISTLRSGKLAYTLVGWRRFLGPYSDLTIPQIYAGIEKLKTSESQRGTEFSDHAKYDYVRTLKQFCTWMMEDGYITLLEKKLK
jgi:hypothetical protein